ncbi:dTDP-3-amino-3,6-dideoxy-alpha-D-galactopyranose transaminase [Gimesia alba]|uniref:dTDP-3-amino-3,6-dideoxy-alpha-D-galactopyranose transaminase n=1 Tax=Gimesia alba TaxID=2527973 RepID=A0A517RGQ0_9PLAN|nr:DegT/DnrJ/EryC1/StrS family aminotransferase [Gimesia alba]QDT43049.1 dTDP-3-amino-3,6-dideoxy-alpha-D-galactopyranose transaminase [Gimesia alba]
MKILFNQPKRENDELSLEINAAIKNVLESGIYILGNNVTTFEEEFAAYCNAKYCYTVGNGTDALEIALRALDIGESDEVITVANAGGYSTTACNLVGATPVYIDVDENRLLLNVDQISSAVSPKTKCVIATHLYGQAVDIKQLRAALDAARHTEVKILEDCAQAHGATSHGKKVGALGDIATFSFYPTKNLGALGDGGAITTSCDNLAERCKSLRQYGWTSKYCSTVSDGQNSRLDEIQAAILRVKLKQLDAYNQRRQEICAHLHESCQGIVDVVTTPCDDHVSHLFVVRNKNREKICKTLNANGIATDIHYPILDLDQQSMKNKSYRSLELTYSNQATQEIFSLPCYTGITSVELDHIRQIFQSKISEITKDQ